MGSSDPIGSGLSSGQPGMTTNPILLEYMATLPVPRYGINFMPLNTNIQEFTIGEPMELLSGMLGF
jgi:hypothetical protein